MQITHKAGDNNYFVDLNNSELMIDPGKLSAHNENDIKLIDTNNSQIMRFGVERDFFMKTILEGFINTCQVATESKKIVMDFSSPNIAKPFHVGHLRSTIIGNFIANVNKHFNNSVTKINYLGDWGTQFGLLQYGLKAKNIDVQELRNDPIKKLYETYVLANKLAATDENVQIEARKYFADIEQGRVDLGSWKRIREVTVQELQKVYQRLGISFDEYHWESDYNGKAIKDLMTSLEEKNILKTDESGKKVARVKDRNVTVLKSDNSTLYLSRDIAALIDRYKRYNFDEMLYIVDNAQTDHFAAVFDIVNQVNSKCASGCKHVKFGRIKGMSTRSGNAVFLNDILNEAKLKMAEQQQQSKSKNLCSFIVYIMMLNLLDLILLFSMNFSLSTDTRSAAMDEVTCDTLGTTAVIINDLKQKRQRDYVFEWDRALQSEGDSGIKLQYLHCRLWSLEKNCGVAITDQCSPEYLQEPIVSDVIAELAKFDDMLLRAKNEYEACIIVNYLFRLSRQVNRMFNELNVKNVEPDLAAQRLLVFYSARQVVKRGLEILGVQPLFEM